MSVSDDHLYEDLSLISEPVAAKEGQDSPNKSSELHLFEEYIISKETEKTTKKFSDLKSDLKKAELEIKSLNDKCNDLKDDNVTLLKNISSLWKTAIAQLREKDKKITALEKEKEAIIFRRAIRQISKDELDRVVSRIAAYNKEEFKEFLKVLNLRNNEDLKTVHSQERTPKVSYKSNLAIRETVLGTRVSTKSHSLAYHLQRLQDGNKITMKASDKQTFSEDCDSQNNSAREKGDKAVSEKHSRKEQRRGAEFKTSDESDRSCKESSDATSKDDLAKKSSNGKSIPGLDTFSNSRDDPHCKRRHNAFNSGKGISENEYPFTHLRPSDNSERNDLEEGELSDEDTKDGSETEPKFKDTDKAKGLVDTQPRINDIRAWRIPKIKNRKSGDGKENELTEYHENHLRDVHTLREKSYKTLSEKNDGRHHISKTPNIDERSCHSREKRNKNQDGLETEIRSPRKWKRHDRKRWNYENFDRRRKSDYTSRGNERRADFDTHWSETRRDRTPKRDFSKNISTLIENLRRRNCRRSVSRQPYCNIYKLRRIGRESKESNPRGYGRCRSRNYSRERRTKRDSPIREVTTNVKRHHSPHVSEGSRRSRSGSSRRSQSMSKSDKEKPFENCEIQDSKSSSSKSDYKQKDTHKYVSVEKSKHPNREYPDKNGRKTREFGERNKKTIKDNSSSDKSRDKPTDKKLERKSIEKSDVEVENRKVSQNKKQNLGESNVAMENENERFIVQDCGQKISSMMENNTTHLEYENENNSLHILPSTSDPPHFQFDLKFSNMSRKEGESPNIPNDNSHVKTTLENELRFDVVQAVSTQSIMKNTTAQESSPCISEDKPKNEKHKHTSRSLSVFSDSENSLAFPFNTTSKENGPPEEEDTFERFIQKRKEMEKEPSMLQNDDSEMSLLKYIGINLSKQKSDQNSLTFSAVSPPPFVLPLIKSPTIQVDNDKLQKTSQSSEVGSDKLRKTFRSSDVGSDKPPITSHSSKVDNHKSGETSQFSEVGSNRYRRTSQSAEVDSDKPWKDAQSSEFMMSISKDLGKPISGSHYLDRPDHLSPVCSIPPGKSFHVPTPTSHLPYSINALLSMETPHKTLSTSSCSPIPAATPLNLSGDTTHISTPPPLSSTLKSSTPVVVFDLNKNPSLGRNETRTLVEKISPIEVGGNQPMNASLPSPSSVSTSEKLNFVLDHSRDREGHVDGNIEMQSVSSTQPITVASLHDPASDSEKNSVATTESERKKKIPFITISKEVSRKGELFSNHEQYGFASSFYKNLDEFEHDWPSRLKISDNSKKPSEKSPQKKNSRLAASASTTTDSNSCSTSASSSSSGSSSSSSSSSSTTNTGTSSSSSGGGSTSLGKITENNSNSGSQNSPPKTSFKNALTPSPTRKNIKSLDKKQSPKKQISNNHTSFISQANEKDKSPSDENTFQMKSQYTSKSPPKKRTRRIKPTPVPRDSGSELSLSNFEESHSSSLSSATEYLQDFYEKNTSDDCISSNMKTHNVSSPQSKSSKENNINCIVGMSSPKESFKALLNDPIISDPCILSSTDSETPKNRKGSKRSNTSLTKNISNVNPASVDTPQKLSETLCSSVVSEAQDGLNHSSRFEDKQTPLQVLSPNVSTNAFKSGRNRTPKHIKIITPETVIVVTNKSQKRARSLTPSNVGNVISIVYTGKEKSDIAEDNSNCSEEPRLRRSPRKKNKTNPIVTSPEESENSKDESNGANKTLKLKSTDESKSEKGNVSHQVNHFKIYRPVKRRKVTLTASSTSSASVK